MKTTTKSQEEEKPPNDPFNFTRELVITILGVFIAVFELINSELLGRTFHYEFLILSAGCLGLAIAGWGDRR